MLYYDLDDVSFEVISHYNGESVRIDSDYYEPERERIINIFNTRNFDYKLTSILYDISQLVETLPELPRVAKNIENVLENQRIYLLNNYLRDIDELWRDYEEHRDDPENRQYSIFNMPGRVNNYLIPWTEALKKPKLFLHNNKYNKQYKRFCNNTIEFIEFINIKIKEYVNKYKRRVVISTEEIKQNKDEIEKLIKLINETINDTLSYIAKQKHTKRSKVNHTKRNTINFRGNDLIELDIRGLEELINSLKKYFEQRYLPTTTTQTEETEIVYHNYKIHFNLKIKDIVRLLYIAYQENEKLTDKYYNFHNHQNIYNFIDKYCVINKVSGKPETINKETLQRYYRDTIKDPEPYREWEQNKYYSQFSQALNELDQNNTN